MHYKSIFLTLLNYISEINTNFNRITNSYLRNTQVCLSKSDSNLYLALT